MTKNLGNIDRLLRVVLGIVLLGLYGALDAPWRYLTLIGLVLIASAFVGNCPIYGLVGISTRRPSSRSS